MSTIHFTADEHYFHLASIGHSSRPFIDLEEMHAKLIENNNKTVKQNDTVYHFGDFTFSKNLDQIRESLIHKLNGRHVFTLGSHDYWHAHVCKELKQRTVFKDIQQIKWKGEHIVGCHYALAIWPRSHYGSWHVYGHSHGSFQNTGKSWDVGVDNNNYTPVSFEQLIEIMKDRPANVNYIPLEKRNKGK